MDDLLQLFSQCGTASSHVAIPQRPKECEVAWTWLWDSIHRMLTLSQGRGHRKL